MNPSGSSLGLNLIFIISDPQGSSSQLTSSSESVQFAALTWCFRNLSRFLLWSAFLLGQHIWSHKSLWERQPALSVGSPPRLLKRQDSHLGPDEDPFLVCCEFRFSIYYEGRSLTSAFPMGSFYKSAAITWQAPVRLTWLGVVLTENYGKEGQARSRWYFYQQRARCFQRASCSLLLPVHWS